MRVPTYQQQTNRTPKTGAINFSVRANPGAAAAGMQAIAGALAQAENTAVTWYETEKKEERLNQLTKAENAYKVLLQDLKVKSTNEDPNTVMNGNTAAGKESWEATAVRNMQKISNAIEDKRVRSAFERSAQQIMIGERASVYQSARNRQIDIAKADEFEKAEILIKDAVQGSGHQRVTAMLELFGSIGGQAGEYGTAPAVTGHYEQMADRGLITRTEAFNYIRNTKQRIAKSDFRTRLASADKSGDPTEAAQLVADVNDPRNFVDMKPEDRDTAFTQAVNLEQQLQKRQVQLAEKAEVANKKEQTRRHEGNERDIIARIITANENPNDSSAQSNRPTSLELADLLRTDGISDSFARIAEDLINDIDAEVRDPDLIADIFSKLSEAKTDVEIDDAVARIRPNMGKGGSVPLEDALSLLRFADGKKTKTVDSTDIDFYRQQLEDATGATAYRISGLGVGQDEVFRQLDAADTYRRLTLDPVKPMPGREAFKLVLEQFMRARQERINFLAPATFLNDYFDGKKPQTWTGADIDTARSLIAKNSNLTQLEKVIEYETLDEIIQIIDKSAPPPAPSTNNQQDNNWFDRQYNRLFGGSNSISDREKALQKPK